LTDASKIAPEAAPPPEYGLAGAASFRFGPLQRRLFLTVLVGLLPLVVLGFGTLYFQAQAQKEKILSAAQDTMRAIVSAVDTEHSISLAALDSLAGSPRLANDDMEGFHREAQGLLQRRPQWTNIVLARPDGQQVMNARLGFGAPLPRVAPESIAEVAQSGKVAVSNLTFAPVSKTQAFAVRIPIRRDGAVKYVLSAVMDPRTMQQLLARQRVAEGGVVGIFDRNYSVVGRSLNPETWAGKPASPGLLALLRQGGESGWTETKTLEGRPVYSVFYRSPSTGWSAAIGIPTEMLDAPINRSLLLLGGSILLSAVVGLLAAWLAGNSITRPMLALETAAGAIGRGETPVYPVTGLPEIRSVATALAAGHAEKETLLQRERSARMDAQSAEAELRRLNAQLSDADRRKDEFLATLAHELRNPLAPISAALQILRLKDSKDPDERISRDIIERQVNHMTHLVDDLLDVARITRGSIELRLQRLDLRSVVNSAIEAARPMMERQRQHLTVEFAPAPIHVDADSTRLAQVLSNLLHNASKYTPKEGRILIDVGLQDGEAVISVSDNGIGIESEHLERIFEMFSQIAPPLDRTQGGLGIGLALVKGLVEMHGGRVCAFSEGAGRGTRVEIRLPTVDGAPPSVEPIPPNLRGGRQKILVVDDNIDGAESLALMLKLCGHDVAVAHDGVEAVAQAEAFRPNLILLDVGLPRMNGYEVVKQIRLRPWSSATIIVAVTGWGQIEDKRRAHEAGFHHHLTKPVDFEALQRILDALEVGRMPRAE
jgi:signal transduction histidine kinase/ActR/RegA family two-component response regulator